MSALSSVIVVSLVELLSQLRAMLSRAVLYLESPELMVREAFRLVFACLLIFASSGPKNLTSEPASPNADKATGLLVPLFM